MEEQKDQGNQPAGSEIKPNNGMTVVGINLLVLVAYTLFCKLASGSGGFILDAFFIFIHMVFCAVMAIGKRSGVWSLSALLVLAIGFSTCYMLASVR